MKNPAAGELVQCRGLASTDVVENQRDLKCVAVVYAKAAIGPVG